MARKQRNAKWARPIPGNTMTVTLPFEYTSSTPIDMNLNGLLKNFPVASPTGNCKPIAFKLVSVSVASTATVSAKVRFKDGLQFEDAVGSGKILKCRPAKDGVVGGWHSITGSVRLYGSSSAQKVGAVYGVDGAGTTGTPTDSNPVIVNYPDIGTGITPHISQPFSFAGELKAVTLAFRLPDGATQQ